MGQSQSSVSDAALMLQNLERMQFSRELQNNPNQYNQYVRGRIDEMTDEVANRKRTAFQKAQIDLGRYMDMDHNANYYKTRSGDVVRLTDMMDAANRRVLNDVERDKSISKRQFEINDWYNYNKLETLFFLQVFFISALLLASIIYLNKNGAITSTLSGLLTTIIVLVVGGLGVYRYYYTNRVRDPRLWNRRYFGPATPPKAPAKCSPDGTVEFDLNDIIPKEVTQCADKQAARFANWQENLESELKNYQLTGEDPAPGTGSLLCGGTGA